MFRMCNDNDRFEPMALFFNANCRKLPVNFFRE